MSALPPAFLAAFEEAAPGASPQALASFLWLLAREGGSPAGLVKGLGIPQAAALRALGELEAAGLVALSAPHGRAGRRNAALTDKAAALSAALEPGPPPLPTPLPDR